MQDEQDFQAQRSIVAGQDQYAPPPRHGAGNGELPYQPRARRARPQGQGQADAYAGEGYYDGSGNRDGGNPAGMLAMEDKLNQFAEGGYSRDQEGEGLILSSFSCTLLGYCTPSLYSQTYTHSPDRTVGKQTLTSLFSKARAKYTEFQTQAQTSNNPNAYNRPNAERARQASWADQPWLKEGPGGGRGGAGSGGGTWAGDGS
jgi:hypothetical protein